MENQKDSKQTDPIKNVKKEIFQNKSDLVKKSSKASLMKKNILKKPQIKNRELEKKMKELAEMTKSYRYLQAEFANFKRIVQKENEQAVKYSSFVFLQDIILNFLNDFNRAMEKKWEDKDFENFKKGVEMLHSKFIRILKHHGMTEIIPKEVPFDPNLHEVVSVENNAEHADNIILHICRNGYQLHDRLVQPAQVIVNKKPQVQSSSESSMGEDKKS